jgi:plastocyanin
VNSINSALTEVSVTKSGFAPKTLTVGAGKKVTWMNNDSVVHYIAPADHPDHIKYVGTWDDDGTGRIAPGEAYTVTISTPGTYSYHDHLNPVTTGTLIIE